MPNPQFIEENPISLVDLKEALQKIEERDKELGYRANKVKEYLAVFPPLSKEKKEAIYQKLTGLKLVRLKDAHVLKIIDFLPKNLDDLRVILQAYPTLTKKDMEVILAAVKEAVE